jgi:hypothetical protein
MPLMDSNYLRKCREMSALPSKAAQNAAHLALNVPIDPGLVAVAEAWPTLPAPIKAGILAMIGAAK